MERARKKRDRIHSFQIFVCGKTESQLLISAAAQPRQTDTDVYDLKISLTQYEPNATPVYSDFSVLTGNEKATWCINHSQSEHIWCIIYSCGDQWDFTGGVASMIDRMSCVTYDGGLKYLYFVEITDLVRKFYSFWPSVEKDAFCIYYSWVTASTEKPAKT